MSAVIGSNISDEDILRVFANTNFGRTDLRNLLEQSTLKKLVGHRCGHTITTIMRELGLIGVNDTPTKKGKAFVAHAYADLMMRGG